MTEKHLPILIDLDLRRQTVPDAPAFRLYDAELYTRFIGVYVRQLAKYMDVTGARFYVMEKPHGGVVKNRAKDGVHIVCPDVVLAPETQLAVRAAVLPEVGELFAKYTDNTAAECFDEAMIARNNWIMYGSSKQDSPLYQVTRAFRVGPDVGLVESLEADDPCDYVELFSIRSKRELTPLVATAPVKSEVVRKHLVKGEVVRVCAISNIWTWRRSVGSS